MPIEGTDPPCAITEDAPCFPASDLLTWSSRSFPTKPSSSISASKAHCLNRVTALVWRNCDGRTDLAGLARLVEREQGITGGAVVVQLALEQLASRHLLEGTVERGSAAQRRSRREVLKRLAAAAVTLPVILTVAAPRANAATLPHFCSHNADGTTCGTGQVCCQEACVTPAASGSTCAAACQCRTGIPCTSGKCCIPLGGTGCTVLTDCCAPTLGCLGGRCFACFPAGTLVGAERSLRPIESFRPDERVCAFDLANREWTVRPVIRSFEHQFEGDLVALDIGGDTVEATGNHPFWVIRGDARDCREQAQTLPLAPASSRTLGRWVEAGSLRVGDVLLLLPQRQVAVDRILVRPVCEKVYNLEVEELHTYAVGTGQVLVHNK